MEKIKISLLFLAFFLISSVNAQMSNGKYGNEWIDFDQTYLKVKVAEDGIYRIPAQVLEQSGIPTSSINGSQYQLFLLGEQIPIHTSSSQALSGNDYIEFYGRKNRSDFDRFLFADPDNHMLNPEYSLYTDTSVYYLTWNNSANNLRYQQVTNNLNNVPAKAEFYMHDELLVFSDTYVKRRNGSIGNSSSHYDIAEGFSTGFPNERVHLSTIEPVNIVASGPDSRVSVRFATQSGLHHQVVKVNNVEYAGEEFGGYAVKQFDFEVPTAEVVSKADIKVEGLEGTSDRQAVAFIKLTYPRTFDFGNANTYTFTIGASNSVTYLEIENFDTGSGTPVLYDLTNNTLQPTTLEGGVIKIALSRSPTDRTLVLLNTQTGVNTVGALQPVSFVDYQQQDASFVIISNKMLYDDGQGRNWVQEYANYRGSEAGGGFSTAVIDVDQLYEQFAYGMERHPLAVRNFGHFIKDNWASPRYIFIIGKGREYAFTRTKAQLDAGINASFAVPTYGVPGSDNLLLSRDDKGVPTIPVGRIAASEPRDIQIYLDKVSTMEQTQNSAAQTKVDKEWVKRILHLSGGSPVEQATIASYLEQMELLIEGNDFGGDVSTFYKTSSDPVQISTSEEIFDLINNGVSIITFFGHSGVGTFDFNIDNPDNYTNFARYPVILSLGCYIGNIHTPVVGASERFIFYEDKGAIAFVASTGVGFTGSLYNFYRELYNQLGSSQYGKSIGEAVLGVLTRFQNTSGTTRELVQQNTINGDPAIIINAAPGPDYIIDPSSVSFEPSVVTAQQDSFDLIFSVNNIGKNVTDSIQIEVIHELPSGAQQSVVLEKIPAPSFSKSFRYTLATYEQESVGLNRFFVRVDINNDVEELPSPLAEQNNELVDGQGRLGKDLYIVDNSVRAVFPDRYGIVGSRDLMLKASTGNALAGEQKYIFELDTTRLFNSPLKERAELVQTGGVLKWRPGTTLTDNTVYYWRVSQDSTQTLGYVWDYSSFLFSENSQEGWNQSHFYQFTDDEYEGMRIDSTTREIGFNTNGFFIRIVNKVNKPNDPPAYIYDFGNAAASVRPWDFLQSGIAVVVGDSVTGGGQLNPPGGNFGSVNPNQYTRVFAFPTGTPSEREALMNFLTNEIPSKSYVWLFSVLQDCNQDFVPEEWEADKQTYGTNIFEILEAQGATLVRSLANSGSLPYTFIYRKDVQTFAEDIAADANDILTTDVFIPILRTAGDVRSTVIGPAAEWQNLTWQSAAADNVADTVYLTVYGLDNARNETILVDRLMNTDTSLSFIDAATYPYLRLQYNAMDNAVRTANNLEQWRVQYQGLPEIAVNPSASFSFYNDTLQQGDPFTFHSAIENIGLYDMDSLLIKTTVTDQVNNSIIQYQRLAPLAKGDTLHVNYQLPTMELTGVQSLVLEVNPDKDQAENYRFNNFLAREFSVSEDIRNPNLDVTFDGIHIMNGDIVSSRPDIQIVLQDENQFLQLIDTSLFRVFLQHPDARVEKLSFNNEAIEFFPASGNENKANVQYRPQFDVDGSYQLIIQAEDVSGNQSGDFDYKVAFEILNNKSISNVLNYPNPFSTSTQFVYTLTGHEPPDYFKIQIMTVSGRIVREITQDETGPLRIGTHKMDYIWDGTDEFGDRLANGVYLYRLVAKSADGTDYERYDNNTDQFFKNDFGKLVIMR